MDLHPRPRCFAMATRGRHNRDDSHKEFTGRVRRWTRVWVPAKEPKSKELKFQRWLQTGGRGLGARTAASMWL